MYCYIILDDPNELEVVIDGKNADEPSVCVGQNVTFVCTVLADTHAWSSPWLSQTMLISIGKSQFVNRGFTMQLITFNGMYITSSASINATTELNNTFVSCTDANSLNGDSQTINITVLGELHYNSLMIELHVSMYTRLSEQQWPPDKQCQSHVSVQRWNSCWPCQESLKTTRLCFFVADMMALANTPCRTVIQLAVIHAKN